MSECFSRIARKFDDKGVHVRATPQKSLQVFIKSLRSYVAS